MNRTYHPRGEAVHGYWPVNTHPLYNTWADMLSRCTNSKSPEFKHYGGRGIKVDPRWFHFKNFAEDMWPKPDDFFTIERRENNSGYDKNNCTWATRTEQALNRRTFSNNSSGKTGVVGIRGKFEARFEFEHVRYSIGRFETVERAAVAREQFVDLFFKDREVAVAVIESETIWCTSSTKARGVTPHADGGSISRATRGGERVYLGYFQTIEEARDARTRFLEG